ncbi:HD domain-containing phosphohydrolase [Motiliproteus sediminis]|uniref:HD domain-containing phosphohydrolase n=1 Tax=Motiliproteus sediminis TaxID=1468178 RepID=UPI001AEF980B|nr:HD domain-containing phosphohydrolase [Motiliproteus sediminis]
MRIRYKLLSLLTLTALGPLLLFSLLAFRGIDHLGDEVSRYSSDTLLAQKRAHLETRTRTLAALLRAQLGLIEQGLQRQVETLEAGLRQPPASPQPYAWATDFDRGLVATDGTTPAHKGEQRVRHPISHATVSLLQPPGAAPAPAGDINLLTSLLPVYRSVHADPAAGSLWHTAALESGLHSSFPGHGGYPDGFDPRQRDWYRQAAANGGLQRSDPYIDATTGRLLITLSRRFLHPDGTLAGVTAIDLSLDQTFARLVSGQLEQAPLEISLMALPPGEKRVQRIAAAAADATQLDWLNTPLPDYIDDTSGRLFDHLAGLRQGQVRLEANTSSASPLLWAYTPIRPGFTYLLLTQSLADFRAQAQQAAAAIQREDNALLQQLWFLGAVILLLCILVAWWVSFKVTRSLTRIAATANHIASGDLDSRTGLHRNDEIGNLSNAVDRMADSIEELQTEQESALLQMLRSLTRALEKKDSYTAAHSGRVARYSLMLGKRVGLSQQQLDLLKRGALVHDLGKIGVPDNILNKPSPLNDEELEVMSEHPSNTASIMKPLVRFHSFAEIAAWHHERWDGKGYPDGLAGDEIPLLARIVAIADTWDAMTGDRVYRKGMSSEKALSILESEQDSGQWDPALLRAFIAMVRDELNGKQNGAATDTATQQPSP